MFLKDSMTRVERGRQGYFVVHLRYHGGLCEIAIGRDFKGEGFWDILRTRKVMMNVGVLGEEKNQV